MPAKSMALEEAISGCEPGSMLGLGGAALRRKPMALVRALTNTPADDLEVATWVGSMDVELLLAAGRIRRLHTAYVGFGPLGLSKTLRRAHATDTVEVFDWSESSFITALRAGASGLPFGVTRSLIGTSIGHEYMARLSSPFDGVHVDAVRALRPRLVLLHATEADEHGNVLRSNPSLSDDIDPVLAAAGSRVVVSVERFVSREEVRRRRDEVVIPGHLVTAVVEAPGGGHPGGCDAEYDADLEHISRYQEAVAAGETELYLRDHVLDVSHHDYQQRVNLVTSTGSR